MLVGTGDVKIWLGIPEADKKMHTKLNDIITAVEGFITNNYCMRPFEGMLYATHSDYCYFDGTGQPFLYLPAYPIWYVNDIRMDADRNFAAGAVIATNDIMVYGKEGKIVSEAGYFTRGRRNVRVEYYAGYAAGTHVSHDGQGTVAYPVPNELKQVIREMVVQSLKEGITAVHTVAGAEESRFMQLLTRNSMWTQTLNKYKRYDAIVASGYDI